MLFVTHFVYKKSVIKYHNLRLLLGLFKLEVYFLAVSWLSINISTILFFLGVISCTNKVVSYACDM